MFGRDFAASLNTMCFVLLLSCQLLQDFEVVDLSLEFQKRIDQRAKPRDFLDVGLGAFAVRPKIRSAHARLKFA